METHWRELDSRKQSLEYTVTALQSTIQKVDVEMSSVYSFDAMFAIEATTPIIGLCFIAMQNYINHTIADFFPDYKKHKYYNLKNKINCDTKIDLIIALANFAKHKEEEETNPNLLKHTNIRLEKFGLSYHNDINETVHSGLSILTQSGNLTDVLEILYEWRKLLIEEFHKSLRTF